MGMIVKKSGAPNIRSNDMLFLDELFEMRGSNVPDFLDRTMSRFFAEDINVDIDAPFWSVDLNS